MFCTCCVFWDGSEVLGFSAIETDPFAIIADEMGPLE